MRNDSIPLLKRAQYPEQILVPIEREVREELHRLKDDHHVNVQEWIRCLIKENLPDLKAAISK